MDPEDIDRDIGKANEKVENVDGKGLMEQLDQGGVSAAHVTWNKMAEITTTMIQGEEEEEVINKVAKIGGAALSQNSSSDRKPSQWTRTETL